MSHDDEPTSLGKVLVMRGTPDAILVRHIDRHSIKSLWVPRSVILESGSIVNDAMRGEEGELFVPPWFAEKDEVVTWMAKSEYQATMTVEMSSRSAEKLRELEAATEKATAIPIDRRGSKMLVKNRKVVGFVCSREKPVPCSNRCGRDAEVECEHPLSGRKAGENCGRKLCRRCAVKLGGKVRCPPHAELTREQAGAAEPRR
jgi:hypothetical protein